MHFLKVASATALVNLDKNNLLISDSLFEYSASPLII
jgi:hypothetical protein